MSEKQFLINRQITFIKLLKVTLKLLGASYTNFEPNIYFLLYRTKINHNRIMN